MAGTGRTYRRGNLGNDGAHHTAAPHRRRDHPDDSGRHHRSHGVHLQRRRLLYAALLPTADIVNAIVTVLPGYAINLFLDGIEQMLSGDIIGGLLNAIGLLVAAAVGLVTTAALIEVEVIGHAIAGVFTLE